jgi:hypothetical protein
MYLRETLSLVATMIDYSSSHSMRLIVPVMYFGHRIVTILRGSQSSTVIPDFDGTTKYDLYRVIPLNRYAGAASLILAITSESFTSVTDTLSRC